MLTALLLLQAATPLPPTTPPARYRVELVLFDGERQVAAPVLDLAEGAPPRMMDAANGYRLRLGLARLTGGQVRLDTLFERRTGDGWRVAGAPVMTLRPAGYADLTNPRTRFRVSVTVTRLADPAGPPPPDRRLFD